MDLDNFVATACVDATVPASAVISKLELGPRGIQDQADEGCKWPSLASPGEMRMARPGLFSLAADFLYMISILT